MASYVLENTDDAYIISVKAFGSDGKGDVSDVYAAVQYAINSDVDVILMAFSLRDNGNYDAFKALVAEAEASGITIIAAAGNKNADASGYIPANINGVLTIGAVDADGYKLSNSNYGDAVEYYVNAESTSQAGTLSYKITSDAIADEYGSKFSVYDGLNGYKTKPIRIANNLTGTFSETNALSLVKRTETPDNFDITGTVLHQFPFHFELDNRLLL